MTTRTDAGFPATPGMNAAVARVMAGYDAEERRRAARAAQAEADQRRIAIGRAVLGLSAADRAAIAAMSPELAGMLEHPASRN